MISLGLRSVLFLSCVCIVVKLIRANKDAMFYASRTVSLPSGGLSVDGSGHAMADTVLGCEDFPLAGAYHAA